MSEINTGSIESRKDFKETPSGQYKFWSEELKGSGTRLKNWTTQGTKIVQRYKGGNRKNRGDSGDDGKGRSGGFRLNLFHSNTITLQSMLYGNLPKIDVSRKNADSNDDVGRVAAEIMERVLNTDVEDNSSTYDSVLKATLQDRLLPGLGCAKVRYEVELDGEQVVSEEAPVEYHHWRDIAYSWGRTYADLTWIGFRNYMTKDEIKSRFGDDAAEGVQLSQQAVADKEDTTDSDTDSVWMKAEVWEIWDKVKKKVVWVSPGYDKVLESKDDFLKLSNFYPCPPFLLANQTTSLYVPVSDFYMAQDLYNEIDVLQTRISIITEAVKVVGVYDKSSSDISRMFKEGTDNDLIPVDNWALFAERGGIAGQIDWVPIEDITNALDKLITLRDQTIGLLQQVTGMSDIMRGELSGQYEGVGQSKMKAQFGSIRVQAMQEEFATFATNLMTIKAEIIGRHFEPEEIARLANVQSFMEPDMDKIGPAIELIKNPEESRLRVVVRSESMAMIDYQQLQTDRTEYLSSISTFLGAAAPLVQDDPRTKPFVLQLLQWGLAGFKGADSIEGVIDKAIEVTMQESEEPEKPDPEQQRMQNNMQLEQTKHENNMKEIMAKSQAKQQEEQADMMASIQKMQADLQADLQVIATKMQADVQTEIATSMTNMEQNNAAVMAEIQKKTVEVALEIQKAKEISNVQPAKK